METMEQKRLRVNASHRRWYNQLSEDKKAQMLEKKRLRYAATKKHPPIGTDTDSLNIETFHSTARKGIIMKDMPSEERRRATLNNATDKGKAKISATEDSPTSRQTHGSSYEKTAIRDMATEHSPYEGMRRAPLKNTTDRGKGKEIATEESHISRQAPYRQDFASREPYHNIEVETQAFYLQDRIDHSTTSRKRQRGNAQKGSTKTNQNYLDNIGDRPLMLPSAPPCKYCAAKRFYHEPKGFCCSDGDVSLISNTIPEQLYNLYTSQSENSNQFRTYIRTYNNTFAFTSFGVKYDKDLCRRNKGIYTFKIQGQVYHYINDILPKDHNPTYLQLYFYDTEHEANNRMNQSNKLKAHIVEQIIDILSVNPYANFFRSLTNIVEWTDQQIIIRKDANLDQRVFNTPSSSQIAAIWFENTKSTERQSRDIIVYNHTGYKHKVEHYYGCYDPLQYPLLFPYGETGWHQGIKRANKEKKASCKGQSSLAPYGLNSGDEIIKKEAKVLAAAKRNSRDVSCREYYCYKLQIRPNDKSILLRAGRLLQQYVVDMYVKIETSRLDYFRLHQSVIRSEVYQEIKDSIKAGETRGSKVGKRIVLPASFTGGPRDMRKRYVDAMTLVQKFGKPDIMLTMTCNPNWPEIKSELCPGEESQNRPDLCARVFKSKLELLKDDLIKKEILGPVAAYTYVIEYQKRGLPHAHFALIFKRNAKLLKPDSYDKIVCAELPDKDKYPHLYEMVVKHMMHGPCGSKNPLNVCMKRDGRCKNHYPKNFCSTTTQGEDSYPIYRRRDDGKQVRVRNQMLDNRWVVPYNPYLLAKFDCHINVEICSSIKVVKYLYKYIYKGHDQIAFNIVEDQASNVVDEIQQFQTARWISAPEAMWRIYGFDLNEMRPPVQSLNLHLEGKQLVTFTKYDKLQNILQNPNAMKTMLTEFFNYNKANKTDEKYLYKEFPEHFVWDQQRKIWTKRKQNYSIGRIITANPSEGERYYLRLLLNHIKGPTSFQQLQTVGNCIVPTFREAALQHGLLESDNSLEQCLQEAITYQMPETLRRLFATILVYCSPKDPKQLWNSFELSFIEDYKRINVNDSIRKSRIQALKNINSKLQTMGKNIRDYKISDDADIDNKEENLTKEIQDELNLTITDEDINIASTLNSQQRHAYDIIIDRILSAKNGAFFIDGPGGTGKTYLYCALLATIRSKGFIALATATSGVAASILPGGRTAHSRFKIPIDIDEKSTCNISKQSGLAQLIRAAKLIIWDEATMAKRQAIEAFNNMLQDITDCALPFGGKVVIFGGDFRQVLPVVPNATREEAVDATIMKSVLWSMLEKIRLTTNMRAKHDAAFTNLLLRIGNGTEEITLDDKIAIPTDMLLPCLDGITSIKLLTQHVFPCLQEYANNPKLLTYRAILTPTNDYVDDINNYLISIFPGIVTEYKSFDKTLDESEQGQHEEFLNTLNPIGLPPHILVLKPNCPLMLLRNIDPPQGLSNGTRLICRALTRNLIYAEIATGTHQGREVFIPRIPLKPSDNNKYPIPFQRKQFPVRLCFAMTINKAQGQTLETVGLYLPQPVFSHGQLYVALSRARTSSSVKVLIEPTQEDKSDYNCTKNVVFQEILALANM